MATQVWRAADGAYFGTEAEAIAYEEKGRAASELGAVLAAALQGKIADSQLRFVTEELTRDLYENRDAILAAFWPGQTLTSL